MRNRLNEGKLKNLIGFARERAFSTGESPNESSFSPEITSWHETKHEPGASKKTKAKTFFLRISPVYDVRDPSREALVCLDLLFFFSRTNTNSTESKKKSDDSRLPSFFSCVAGPDRRRFILKICEDGGGRRKSRWCLSLSVFFFFFRGPHNFTGCCFFNAQVMLGVS